MLLGWQVLQKADKKTGLAPQKLLHVGIVLPVRFKAVVRRKVFEQHVCILLLECSSCAVWMSERFIAALLMPSHPVIPLSSVFLNLLSAMSAGWLIDRLLG